MKIIFIQPKSFHCWEALNIGYLISALRANADLDIAFYSGFFDADPEIIQGCKGADIVGVSATSPQMKHGLSISREIKKQNPKCVVVFGGVHPSALPQQTLENDCIDALVLGEGERAIVEIVAEGVKLLNSKKIVSKDYIENLDNLLFPDRVIIKQERNIQQAYIDNRIRIASIFSSRGCLFPCRFCASSAVWGKKVRYRFVQNILEEFEKVVKDFKIDFIKFSDDTFTLNKNLVREFCERKIKQKIKTSWGCNVRADDISLDLLKLMKQAGCREVWIGIESGSPDILTEMQKGITIEGVKRIFKLTKNLGFFRRAYILLGMPNETKADIKLSENLIDEIDPEAVGFTILAPYPGSSFYNHNRHANVDWSEVDEYENKITRTNYLTNDELHNEQYRLVKKYQERAVFRQRNICVSG
ncbi:MAG: radical SAM protein [Candidatus Omnitrophota bacterium]